MTAHQPNNRIPEKVSAALVEFANSLKPSKSYTETGKHLCHDIFKMLQKSRHDISMTYIGGSVGKNTSVIHPDFDCVVFLNNIEPPLNHMVEEFERLLRDRIEELRIVENTFKTTSLTVSLEFRNGVEMDLLPATNFCAQHPEDQHSHAMAKIKDNPTKHSMYSSSLAQTQIKFIKEQSGVTHQLIRLAKYWYKLCTLEKEIYGSGLLVEIICVDVAFDLDPNRKNSKKHHFHMLPAFRLFLEKVSRLNSLKLGFYRDTDAWVRVAPHEFNSKRFRNYFHAEIIDRPNFIIEPSNPYNDLANNIPSSSFDRLKDFADEMLMRLEILESPISNIMKSVIGEGSGATLYVKYENFFQPFIMSLREYYPHFAIPFYVSMDYHCQNFGHKNVNERNPKFFVQNKLAKEVYKTVMNNLLFLIRGKAIRKDNTHNGLSFSDGITDVNSRDDIREAVNTFVKANFDANRVITDSSDEGHGCHDVTLTIPYRLVETNKPMVYAVQISMTWSDNVELNSEEDREWDCCSIV